MSCWKSIFINFLQLYLSHHSSQLISLPPPAFSNIMINVSREMWLYISSEMWLFVYFLTRKSKSFGNWVWVYHRWGCFWCLRVSCLVLMSLNLFIVWCGISHQSFIVVSCQRKIVAGNQIKSYFHSNDDDDADSETRIFRRWMGKRAKRRSEIFITLFEAIWA